MRCSGTYLRIIQSYKLDGKSKHKTLHSLGKIQDYDPDHLERIAMKLLELIGKNTEDLNCDYFQELGRYNYGYALLVKKLWEVFNIKLLARKIAHKHRIHFDWQNILRFMVAERIYDPK